MSVSSPVRKRILVVDDEETVRESLRMLLHGDYDVDTAEDADSALSRLDPTNAAFDLILLDVMMPGIDGLGLLERVRGEFPSLPVIMLTASTTVRSAVSAMKLGAIDYVNKPFDIEELRGLIQTTMDLYRVEHRRDAVGTGAEIEIPGDYGDIVGQHPTMLDLYQKIDQLAQRETTILITGESGTGKELVAREIHRRSKRNAGPFVALNCSAIPESLIESELFGHEKGAFTHAVERRLGQFELADGGTLFLDEIGELTPSVQVKILRFLQEHEFYRIGRSKPIKVDVRVLAATNRSLESAIREGKFRQDLYYRINVVNLEIPPLRNRGDDIRRLLEHCVQELAPRYGIEPPQIEPDAMEFFQSYAWSGNVRELENVVESILALTSGDSISLARIPAKIRSEHSAGLDSSHVRFADAERQFEQELILKALKRANYVQTKAAEILGISRRILKYKMDKLGIAESEQ